MEGNFFVSKESRIYFCQNKENTLIWMGLRPSVTIPAIFLVFYFKLSHAGTFYSQFLSGLYTCLEQCVQIMLTINSDLVSPLPS